MSETQNSIVLVECDEWLGVYLNGELAQEGHGSSGCRANLLAFAQQHQPFVVEQRFADDAWARDFVEENMGLPDLLSDVVGRAQTLDPTLAAQ